MTVATTAVLSPREARVFACLADTLLAPAPPLPPIGQTDAVAAFDAWLATAPRANRLGARAVLLALAAARWPRRPAAARLMAIERVARLGVAGRGVVEALRAAAAVSYYGDPGVSGLLGYTPAGAGERVAVGSAAR
jgi:hypothetical protein